MKKVLFMLINMNVGGTEKALLNMLEEMSQEKYEVTLLLLEEYGGFLSEIPNYVKVQYLENFNHIKPHLNQPTQKIGLELIKQCYYMQGIKLIWIYFLTKLMGEKSLLFKSVLKEYPVLEEQYDVAVAYAGPMDFITYFIAHKVKASLKVQWIHFDITRIGFNKRFAKKYYKKFNRVFVVSNQGRDKLIQLVPSIAAQTETFINRISTKHVEEQGAMGKGFHDDFDGVRLLTVGRLSEEKGQDLCIEACKRLKEEGYKIRWYCVGEGSYRAQCEKLIHKYELEKEFILLGCKSNPYPYMKNCDLYVQSSRHEGYCITLAEAKVFNKPIVTTDFTGAREQIVDGENGVIVEVKAEEIYKGIKQILNGTVTFKKEVG